MKKDIFSNDTRIECGEEQAPLRRKAKIARQGVPYLELAGKRKALSNKAVAIGRDKSNGIIVNDPKVSRIHALIVFEKNQILLRDSGSRNGTFLNGEKIPMNRKVKIKYGDLIRVGDTQFTFHDG